MTLYVKMEKIGILTHYQVHNHGAILQMYALSRVLKDMGFSPFVLTYRKDFSFIDEKLLNKYNISLKSVPFYLSYMKEQGRAKTLFNVKKRKILETFKKNNFSFSPLYAGGMDAVVVGSDEVFSLEAGVNIMMYGHSVPCNHIISYAATFGQTGVKEIRERNCEALISGGLRTLKALSVRDLHSAETIKELCSLESSICFDPVLLYGFRNELEQKCGKIPKKPYMIIYAYDKSLNDKQEISEIRKYAAKKGLRTVSAGFYHKWADKNLNVSPLELMSLISKADCVVTDTFHGSVIASLTNTPFAVRLRERNTNKISYLLGSLGLSERAIDDFSGLEGIFNRKTDWDAANSKIAMLRKQGMDYLCEALGQSQSTTQEKER